MRTYRILLAGSILWAFALLGFHTVGAAESPTEDAADPSPALQRYVDREDDSYEWKLKRTGEVGKTKFAELILTSQTWRGIEWKHQLFVLMPSSSDADEKHGLFIIEGGSWNDDLETDTERLPGEATMYAAISEQLGTPVVILLQVPQQPIFDDLYEDEIISYTFEEFIKTGEEDWPLLLPMVKSAIRGMDTAQEFVTEHWERQLESFTVTGASKRGWTTWLTGAVDERAVAIAPMVIDVLNFVPQMRHQIDSWGEYSEQIADYTEKGLQSVLETRLGEGLRKIVDPYHYRGDLDQPKLIMIGTNDRYWPLDALKFYWDDLSGQKYVLYVPNKGHGLGDLGRLVGGINGLMFQERGLADMPKLSWEFESDTEGTALNLQTAERPIEVNVWVAQSDSRDFRDALWTMKRTEQTAAGYHYTAEAPESGYLAVFGEYKFRRGNLPLYLSTNVQIIGGEED